MRLLGDGGLAELPWCRSAALSLYTYLVLGSNAALDGSQMIGDQLAMATAAGMAHFYFIETPDGTPQSLPVRPWGYVAFLVPGIGVGAWVMKRLSGK